MSPLLTEPQLAMTYTNPLTKNTTPLMMSLEKDLSRKKKRNRGQEIKNQNPKRLTLMMMILQLTQQAQAQLLLLQRLPPLRQTLNQLKKAKLAKYRQAAKMRELRMKIKETVYKEVSPDLNVSDSEAESTDE
jgi:hypothetical protein